MAIVQSTNMAASVFDSPEDILLEGCKVQYDAKLRDKWHVVQSSRGLW